MTGLRGPAEALAGVQLACSHRMCRPGSAECRAKTRALELAEQYERSLDRLNGLLQSGPPEDNRAPHETGCTVAEPCTECRPGGRGTAAERARPRLDRLIRLEDERNSNA